MSSLTEVTRVRTRSGGGKTLPTPFRSPSPCEPGRSEGSQGVAEVVGVDIRRPTAHLVVDSSQPMGPEIFVTLDEGSR
jgi:hypothetical protein